MDRRQTVEIFRERLTEVIDRSGLSRSAFARKAGLDRSTLSQLLSDGNDRLPRAETIASIAEHEQVSTDWLLGLIQEEKVGTNILSEAPEIAQGTSSTFADERLARWRAEAVGYKIRYVPSTLPDLLKGEEVIRFEYRQQGSEMPAFRMEQAEARLAYSRRPETDLEACSSLQSLEMFARGQGIWSTLPLSDRKLQLSWMIALLDELYPTFRWFLFDGLKHYSAPVTIFGPTRAAAYIGNMYFVFNSTEHIRALTQHFDNLIRGAVVQPPDVSKLLAGLLSELESREEKGAKR
ncbi:helix-turn-helix domain-containing protein [Pelagibius litoralis]|uniref:Helix-turn-helix domain-containing protein n=1 Tax=Pelagibius litoralis TaxID=374515 RepID=A0A967C281_9PROT|nr:helix-turn-helix transcriptional regulator [Pelagibius litoralis]NIA68971.1 helix-turn-helix domain-containing protein [Pelagibius litoralis]